MATTLHANGLGAGHGGRTLFSDLDLIIAPGDVFEDIADSYTFLIENGLAA